MSLVLAFVAPKLPAPPPPPLPKVGYKPGPITQARPIAGSYPRLKPNLSPPNPPPPPPPSLPPAAAAAGGAGAGLSLPGVALAFVLAIPQVLLLDSPAGMNYYDLHPPDAPTFVESPVYPFRGGQMPTLYNVSVTSYDFLGRSNGGQTVQMFGPIGGIFYVSSGPDAGGSTSKKHYVKAKDSLGQPKDYLVSTYSGGNSQSLGSYSQITGVTRPSNELDTGGDPPPLNTPTLSNPGNPLGTPSAAPPSAAPSPAPTAPGLSGSPSGSPSSSPSSSPSGFPSPSPVPNLGPLPQPNPAPSPAPNPDPFPQLDPGPNPGTGVGSPNPSPTPIPSLPRPGDPTISNPLTPTPLPAPSPLTPSPLTPNPLSPSPFTPNPNTGNPEPTTPPVTAPPTSPAPTPTPIDEIRETVNRYLGPMAIAIAGITALVQPERLRDAAEAGSCRSFAPGGCNAPTANNAQAAANNSANNGTALASIMAFLQAIQTFFLIPIKAGVELINTKLGPVMSGLNGISGFLTRAAEAAKLDKVLNAMNTVLLLHNAAMLSRNLGSTLGDLTSQVLATIGIKDGDSPIDVNEILGKQANNFMASILGAEVWAGTKTSWNKASSIISSATNLMYTMRSIFDSSREIMEWTAENTGKIGNALKRFRVVGENAYKWLPERVTVQNSFTRKLDRIREGTDSLDDAASSLSGVLGEVQSIQQEYADLQEQKQKFDKNISELTPKPREENKPVSDAAVVAKNASKAPTEIENVFRGEGN